MVSARRPAWGMIDDDELDEALERGFCTDE